MVVVAIIKIIKIIFNYQTKKNQLLGGLWEFQRKVNQMKPEDALHREIKEEVNLTCNQWVSLQS